MNREIKFKVWSKNQNRFLESKDFEYELIDVGSDFGILLHTSSFRDQDDELTKCFYTGLKDKNGKEIYKGDLVKTNDGIAKIYWHDFRCGFEALWIKLSRATFTPEWYDSEVIGNIFENPELLK